MLNIKYNQDPPPISVFEKAQNPIQVAIYARVSSEAQDITNSIEAQIAECRQYAAQHNMEVVAVYIDEAESGTSDSRPQFQQMMADGTSAEKPFESVLVWKFSRFSRSRPDNVVYKHLLKRRGIRIISVSEPIDDGPMGELMESLIEGLDAFYSANLGQEVRRGQHMLAARGYWPGSRAPYGYRLKKVPEESGSAFHNILDIDPVTAPVARRIFDEIIAGRSHNDIRRGLDRDGVPPPQPKNKKDTKSKKWSRSTIAKIAHDLTYAGFIVWNRKSKHGKPPVVAQGRHEPIVSLEELELAGEIMASKAPKITNPRRVGSVYTLSELLVCRKCDRKLNIRLSKNQTYRSHICPTRRDDGIEVCDCPVLDIPKFEAKFFEVLLDDILCPRNVEAAMAKMKDKLTAPYEEQRAQAQAIEAQLLDVSNRQSRIMDAYEDGSYSRDVYNNRIEPLRETEEKLKQHLAHVNREIDHQAAALANPWEVLQFTGQVADFIRHSPPKERKEMLRRFIKCIWIEPGRATVVYRIPLPRDAKRPKATELVLALDEPVPPSVHVGQLQRNLEGVGGHIHPREQCGHVGFQIHIGPQRAGFPGGNQLVAATGCGAVHGRLQVGLPVLQRPDIRIARLSLLSPQDAADTGQVELIHTPVLAEWHPATARAAGPTAVTGQQRLPIRLPLPFDHIANGALQAAHLLLQGRNVRVQPLPVELPHLRNLVLDGFQIPGRKRHNSKSPLT